jgi:uncharacterized protein YxjI
MVFRDRTSPKVSPDENPQDKPVQAGSRYRLMQNLVSNDDAVLVQTDEGNIAFKIETSQRDLMDVLVFRDMDGAVRCFISGFPATSAACTDVMGNDGHLLARVTRTPISAVRDRFEVDIASGGFWMVFGDAAGHEFTLENTTGRVAEVSRRWFVLPNSYGVEVAPGQDDALVLAVATTIDQLTHDYTH